MSSSYYCPPDTPHSQFATFALDFSDEQGNDKTSTTRLTLDGAVADFSSTLGGSFQLHPDAIQCSSEETWEKLTLDCDSLFPLDRSFWIQHGQRPRCALEALACNIYLHHTRNLPPLTSDEDQSLHGIEWWVQIRRGDGEGQTIRQHRRSPRVLARDPEDVNLHWDKDEELIDEGGPIIHPIISTVTYLTSQGGPTLIIPISARNGSSSDHVFLSYPFRGKHISFDGRWLHSAPRFLAREAPPDYLRVTLLVNIWKGYKPISIDPLPQSFITSHRFLGPFAAPPISFQSRRGARIPVIPAPKLGSTKCLCLRFGATQQGEWTLSLPIPRRPIELHECIFDTMRIEFSIKKEDHAWLVKVD